MKFKSNTSVIAMLILALAFLSAMFIILSFSLPPAFYDVLEHYLFKGEVRETPDPPNTGKALMVMQSGITDAVPWENDTSFQVVRQKFPVLMAAYKTVLLEPLPGEEANVHLAARNLAGKIINPGEVFSQNTCLGPYTKEKGFKLGPSLSGDAIYPTYGGGVCKIASTLYNVAVLCNLPIIERHCHSKPVPYVPYGQDATVSYGLFDFRFKNNTAFPILIWAEALGNKLYIAFYGSEAPPQVEWHHQYIRTFKAGNIYKNNPALPKGEERLIEEGADGAIVESWITIRYENGLLETKQLGRSYYDPYPYLYEKNLY